MVGSHKKTSRPAPRPEEHLASPSAKKTKISPERPTPPSSTATTTTLPHIQVMFPAEAMQAPASSMGVPLVPFSYAVVPPGGAGGSAASATAGQYFGYQPVFIPQMPAFSNQVASYPYAYPGGIPFYAMVQPAAAHSLQQLPQVPAGSSVQSLLQLAGRQNQQGSTKLPE